MNTNKYRKFFLYSLAAIILMILLTIALGEEFAKSFLSSPITMLVFFVWAVYFYIVSIKRLQNAGRSGWFILSGAVPILNFYLLYVLLFEQEKNSSAV